MYPEVFCWDNNEWEPMAEASGISERIIYRLPLLFKTPEGIMEVICHENLHASAPGEGTLQLPEWMIDEILSWTGLLRWQLKESGALEYRSWRPRIC